MKTATVELKVEIENMEEVLDKGRILSEEVQEANQLIRELAPTDLEINC